MQQVLAIADIKTYIAKVAQNYDLKRVTLFGSYANGKSTKNSDIDLLVEFMQPVVSFYKVCGLKVDLEELMGKSVDVIHAPLSPDTLLEIDKEVLIYENKHA